MNDEEARDLEQRLLAMLRACAHQLLWAYSQTGRGDYELAFERAVEACKILAFEGTHHLDYELH